MIIFQNPFYKTYNKFQKLFIFVHLGKLVSNKRGRVNDVMKSYFKDVRDYTVLTEQYKAIQFYQSAVFQYFQLNSL